jgi:hypothetical protein
MARLVNDIVTKLFLNSDWRDISGDVRAAGGLDINRGRKSEDSTSPPQTCTFVLDNSSGAYTERDPMGTWYGYLGRNTPIEVSLRMAKDTCSSTVANGWGTMDTDAAGAWTPYTWLTADGIPSNYAKASGKATQTITAAPSGKNCYLSGFSHRDLDVVSTVTMNAVTNIAGGALGVDYLMRMQGSFVDYYYVRMLFNTDETITADVGVPAVGSIVPGGAVPVAGLTWSAGLVVKFRAQIEGQTIRIKIWNATQSEPYNWTLTFSDESLTTDTTTLRTSAGGFVIRTLAGAGNSNVPVTFSFDDIEIRTPLYYGEVSEWPQARDTSGRDKTVEIEAAGVLRRLSQGQAPLQSAGYRFITTNIENPRAYWPLDEGSASDEGAPVYGSFAMTPSLGDAVPPVGTVTWSGSTDLASVTGAPNMTNGGRIEAEVSPTGLTSSWTVAWAQKCSSSSGAQNFWWTTSGVFSVAMTFFTDGTFEVYLTTTGPGSTTVMNGTVGNYDDVWHHYALTVEDNGGGTSNFYLDIDGVSVDSDLARAGTFAPLNRVRFSSPTSTTEPTSVSTVVVFGPQTVDPVTNLSLAVFGWDGEGPQERLLRICTENSVDFTNIGESSLYPQMGPQRVRTLLDIIGECRDVDGGILYEPRASDGLLYRALASMYSRTSWASLSLVNGELSPPWKPTSDDRYLRNKVTVTREDGASYTHEVTSGRNSTLPPSQGGVGIADEQVTLNLYRDYDIIDQAAWRTALGTVDEERYPAVVIELHRDKVRVSNPTLYNQLLSLDVGDQITLADLDATGIYDNPDQVVIGYERRLTRFTHTLVLTCRPASPLKILTLNANARLDSGSSTLNSSLTTTATTVSVATSNVFDLWATTASNPGEFPFDIIVGGERMTVTACTSATSPQSFTVTRSVNAVVKAHSAGAEVHVFEPFRLGL